MLELLLTIFILLVIAVYLYKTDPTVIVVQTPPVRQPPPRPVQTRAPEFRGPPIKQYKPAKFQQMGLLTSEEGEMLPLYGRESRTHRDRYHYYTTTPGQQIYPIPISHDGRDCSEDIGCPEFYGNETASVLGKEGVYTANIYKTENFPDLY
jgi:hypothetical protein